MPSIKNTKPLITIGITTFNASNTVKNALNSALAQTWRPIEIIVVDDCSTDDTCNVLELFAKKNSEVRIFKTQVNRGVAVARNRILSEAKGELVAFFDDDDESLPERITEQYARIVDYELEFSDGAPVICHTARKVIYPNKKVRIEPTMGQIEGSPAPYGIAVAKRILLGTPLEDGYGACPTCSQMARLSVYKLLDGFDPALRRGEDTDFNVRLALCGGHFVGISRPLVIQTMTKTTEKSLNEEYRNMLLLIEKHRVFVDREGQYEFCLGWIKMKQKWLEGRYGSFLLALFLSTLSNPLLTLRRLVLAVPNLGLNFAFSRFHMNRDITSN